ncbi:SDR family oxidoreductase [Paraburkholderia sp. CNPSo 3274]|uniref:SDR family oxidoreductase n=1 Tax=Paraburkholderia sp. CNPSo 3274 TaxID=2940932 RepID=UPI0020B833DF|nr:SDR family oxidoreductase [Paraburkholderia sp. CNPSo 3274]MCP3713518.1 SDR family oxidoreductase [Paraburkholderia sp. CNPSo 3274]
MTDLPSLALTPQCRSLLFPAKMADIAALSSGNRDLLRPQLHPNYQPKTLCDSTNYRVALVIGSNGFVGAHLAARLSVDQQVEQVLAMVRGTAEITAEQRFAESLTRYQIKPVFLEKIAILNASPTEPYWGLDPGTYAELAEQVRWVFNCASSTEYDLSYLQIRQDWVMSFLQVLQFCTQGVSKHLSYLGSVSARFYENPRDFIRPDSWWYSGYAQMKWVNGQVMRWIANDQLFPVTLCEPSYILGSTSLGVDPGLHYSWWRLIEICKSIQQIWDGEGLNYNPVDILTDALVVNALAKKPKSYLQPCNPVPYNNSLLAELLGCEIVSWETFKKTAQAKISSRRLGRLLEDDCSEIVHRANCPAVVPDGYPTAWCDNRALLDFYLQNQSFRDVTKKRGRTM